MMKSFSSPMAWWSLVIALIVCWVYCSYVNLALQRSVDENIKEGDTYIKILSDKNVHKGSKARIGVAR